MFSPHSQYIGEQHLEELRQLAATTAAGNAWRVQETTGRRRHAGRTIVRWVGDQLIAAGERLHAGEPAPTAPRG